MEIDQIELATRRAWPALQEQRAETGLLRFANGVSRRANSMTPHLHKRVCVEALLEETERFYFNRQAPAVVRVISTANGRPSHFPAIDEALECAHYGRAGLTAVMGLDLDRRTLIANSRGLITIKAVSPSAWLEGWYALAAQPQGHRQTHLGMLALIKGRARFLLGKSEGRSVASGFAVMSQDVLGVFGIATEPAHRRLGHSRALIERLLAWGEENGARYACLQVEVRNEAARMLYTGLGFNDCYSYWYRVKQQRREGNE